MFWFTRGAPTAESFVGKSARRRRQRGWRAKRKTKKKLSSLLKDRAGYYGVIMGFLIMGFLWGYYGVPMGFLWGSYGVPMGFLGFLWGSYGVPMGSRSSPGKLPGRPRGRPGKLPGRPRGRARIVPNCPTIRPCGLVRGRGGTHECTGLNRTHT